MALNKSDEELEAIAEEKNRRSRDANYAHREQTERLAEDGEDDGEVVETAAPATVSQPDNEENDKTDGGASDEAIPEESDKPENNDRNE